MSDDPAKTKRGRQRISLEHDHEVRYWTEALGVSRDALQRAVKAVGNRVDDVCEYVKGHRP